MTRESRIIPGYDCRVECQHKVKGEHGQACSEWLYIVKGGDAALTLNVMSGDYPDGTQRPPDASDMTLHVAWRVDVEAVKEGSTGEECGYVDAGRCFRGASTIIGARDFFVAHGKPAFEQPESFWVALEAEFEQWRAEAATERADDKLLQCPTCKGEGVIEKGAGWPEAVARTSDAALRLGAKTDSRCGEFYLSGWHIGASYDFEGLGVRYNVRMRYNGCRRHAGNEQIARALVRGYRDGRRVGRRASLLSKAEVLW